MSRKLFFLGVISLIFAPGAALSIGLGEIRLNSYLNQPISAEIALSVTSAEELETLRVELASMDAFRRSGLDRPAFFDDLRFRVRPTGAATALVEVSSTRPITEPFITFLVEARWSGGRILREYTVLLDPPVFMPAPEVGVAPAPAPPPAVAEPRPAPPPVARPAPTPPPVDAPVAVRTEFGPEYRVQRNDTLWAIAQQVRPDETLTTNQIMVALFRENPHAFDDNINRLRAGTILRVPSRQQMAATAGREATAEVRRQTDAWRAAAPVAAPVERRLELAPPAEVARPPAPVTDPVRDPAAPAEPAPELLAAVQELRSELAETRRLMEVKDAEIAALQARLADLEAEPVPVAPPPAPPVDAPAAPPVDAPADAVAEVAPEPEPATRVVAPAPAPTLLDRVFDTLGALWLWLLLAIVLIAAAVGLILHRRKEHERSIEEDLAETGTWGTLEDTGGKLAVATAAAGAGAGAVARKIEPTPRRRENLESILVEETEAPVPREKPQPPEARVVPPVRQPEPEVRPDEDYQYPFEDTIAGETGINLDQSDPMAEADFHMAYGLYDQAAEIMKKAVEREPDRYDLRRKLIDICFVWGNAEEFLAQAREIRELQDEAAAADWPKISIMGRQICPGEEMFQAADKAGVDLDLGGEEPGAADTRAREGWLDFDVGESDESVQVLGDTREQPAPGEEVLTPEQTAELNLEELGIDLDLGETGEHALQDLAERAPELPDEPADEPDEEALHTSTLRLPGAQDEPEEKLSAPEDDGGTQMLDPSTVRRRTEGPTARGEGWELAEDEPTFSDVGGYEDADEGDDRARDSLVGLQDAGSDEPTHTGFGGFEPDEEEPDHTIIKKIDPSQEAPTAEVGGFEDEDDADLELDELTQSLKAGIREEEVTKQVPGFDPDPEPEPAAEYELGDTAEMAPGEMDEVGTKLDLARAYIDMGDPDGARSILGEVVEEGNEAQREEARQLLDTLAWRHARRPWRQRAGCRRWAASGVSHPAAACARRDAVPLLTRGDGPRPRFAAARRGPERPRYAARHREGAAPDPLAVAVHRHHLLVGGARARPRRAPLVPALLERAGYRVAPQRRAGRAGHRGRTLAPPYRGAPHGGRAGHVAEPAGAPRRRYRSVRAPPCVDPGGRAADGRTSRACRRRTSHQAWHRRLGRCRRNAGAGHRERRSGSTRCGDPARAAPASQPRLAAAVRRDRRMPAGGMALSVRRAAP
jgi:pilus assembly protein FimV